MYGSSNIGVVVLGWRLGKLAGLNCQRLSQVKQGKLGKKKWFPSNDSKTMPRREDGKESGSWGLKAWMQEVNPWGRMKNGLPARKSHVLVLPGNQPLADQ